MLESSCLFID
uniref:Uncharacterized protein n=1 Tax=Lepeophtheirus salmonis TaxID=72036 RepID=A0A0K2V6D1_LEPSM